MIHSMVRLEHIKLVEENDGLDLEKQKLAEEASYAKDLKREISKARIRMIEPFIKDPVWLDYLGRHLLDHYGQPESSINFSSTNREVGYRLCGMVSSDEAIEIAKLIALKKGCNIPYGDATAAIKVAKRPKNERKLIVIARASSDPIIMALLGKLR
ncbi:hypothetical protein Syun_006994 [Stephania yunnanensis]|uniref:Uncharacterized protein n=1 Tax=Stephania yunnanensis TaxID=152371 RepID=A0AAP0KZ47_9MAGN